MAHCGPLYNPMARIPGFVNMSAVCAARMCTVICSLLVVNAAVARAQSPTWRLDPKPILVLGKANGDEAEAFAAIPGATRLPNGNVLVADRGEFSLHLYSAAGNEVRKFGRKGKGPGDFAYLARLYRCGALVLADDIDGSLISVYSTDGALMRTFRFSSKVGNNSP